MAALVALLRGINVGGNTLVSMAALRELAAGLGYEDARTHLQSGNLVLSTRKSPASVASELEKALAREHGRSIRVLVRTDKELAEVVRRDPFKRLVTDPRHYAVSFLSEAPEAARVKAVDAAAFEPEVFRVIGREIYVWLPGGMGRSRLMSQLSERRLGVVATVRNWNTVTALLRMTQPGA